MGRRIPGHDPVVVESVQLRAIVSGVGPPPVPFVPGPAPVSSPTAFRVVPRALADTLWTAYPADRWR